MCIDCGCNVFVLREKLRVWHFAHYCVMDDKKCPHKNGSETLDHYNTKHFIAQNITRCVFVLQKLFACGVFQGLNSVFERRELIFRSFLYMPNNTRIAPSNQVGHRKHTSEGVFQIGPHVRLICHFVK